LGKIHEHVAEVEDDRAAEAEQLSRSTMEISNALVNMNMMPIQGIPLQPRMVKDVIAAFTLVLERLHEKAPVREPDA
jgi:chemotaxis protein histidine kinase CheA